MKLTEKQLFETWLDIYYANQLNEDYIHDLELELKVVKKHRRKTKHLLKKAGEYYFQIYGRYPRHKK